MGASGLTQCHIRIYINAFDSTIKLDDIDECQSQCTCSVNIETDTQIDTQADNFVNGHNDSSTIL